MDTLEQQRNEYRDANQPDPIPEWLRYRMWCARIAWLRRRPLSTVPYRLLSAAVAVYGWRRQRP